MQRLKQCLEGGDKVGAGIQELGVRPEKLRSASESGTPPIHTDFAGMTKYFLCILAYLQAPQWGKWVPPMQSAAPGPASVSPASVSRWRRAEAAGGPRSAGPTRVPRNSAHGVRAPPGRPGFQRSLRPARGFLGSRRRGDPGSWRREGRGGGDPGRGGPETGSPK